MKKLLLISNSISQNCGFLDHCEDVIKSFLSNIKTILYVPYAMKNIGYYATSAKARFKKMGIILSSIHEFHDPFNPIQGAQAIFVGGGNTFRLLKNLYDRDLLDEIRRRVMNGMPYIGVSAGSNLACPTIKTTNDMPIVETHTLSALNLILFQINPHFIDGTLIPNHKGETREQRIKEFHEENDTPVVGLREGSWLLIENDNIELGGLTGAKVFLKGKKPKDFSPGESLDFH